MVVGYHHFRNPHIFSRSFLYGIFVCVLMIVEVIKQLSAYEALAEVLFQMRCWGRKESLVAVSIMVIYFVSIAAGS